MQYYIGALTGTVLSYNYANLQMLASQHYAVCIRQELGKSSVNNAFKSRSHIPSVAILRCCYFTVVLATPASQYGATQNCVFLNKAKHRRVLSDSCKSTVFLYLSSTNKAEFIRNITKHTKIIYKDHYTALLWHKCLVNALLGANTVYDAA